MNMDNSIFLLYKEILPKCMHCFPCALPSQRMRLSLAVSFMNTNHDPIIEDKSVPFLMVI